MSPPPPPSIIIAIGVLIIPIFILSAIITNLIRGYRFRKDNLLLEQAMGHAYSELRLENTDDFYDFDKAIDSFRSLNIKTSLIRTLSYCIWDMKTVVNNEMNLILVEDREEFKGLITSGTGSLFQAISARNINLSFDQIGKIYQISMAHGESNNNVLDIKTADLELANLMVNISQSIMTYDDDPLLEELGSVINSIDSDKWYLYSPHAVLAFHWLRKGMISLETKSNPRRNTFTRVIYATWSELLALAIADAALGIAEQDSQSTINALVKYYRRSRRNTLIGWVKLLHLNYVHRTKRILRTRLVQQAV